MNTLLLYTCSVIYFSKTVLMSALESHIMVIKHVYKPLSLSAPIQDMGKALSIIPDHKCVNKLV